MLSTNPQTQIEKETVTRLLKALPMGDVLTYAKISEELGYDVTKKRYVLMSAQTAVEKDTGFRFATVFGVGVKFLPSDAIAGIGIDARKSLGKKARRHAKRLAGLKYNGIDRTQQQRIDVERSLLGAIASIASEGEKKLATGCQTGPLVASKVFDMMQIQV
jgi:hypothetical protein